jgi:hypothetical protein
LLIIIGLLSGSEWSSFGGKQRFTENNEFGKIHSFACLHHDGFRRINQSVFFWLFISRWRLSFQSELSLSDPIWLEIDEMRVHLCFECFFKIQLLDSFFSAAPKSAQYLTQTSSLYYHISSRDEKIFEQLKSFGKK